MQALSADEVSKWKASDLKNYLAARGIDHSFCVEKQELIALVMKNEQSPTPISPNRSSAPSTNGTQTSSYSAPPPQPESKPQPQYYQYQPQYSYPTQPPPPPQYSYPTQPPPQYSYPTQPPPQYQYSQYTQQSSSGNYQAPPQAKPQQGEKEKPKGSLFSMLLSLTAASSVEDNRSFYEILGVEKDASQSDIKKAYYKYSSSSSSPLSLSLSLSLFSLSLNVFPSSRAAMKYHPDKNPDNPAAEEMVDSFMCSIAG